MQFTRCDSFRIIRFVAPGVVETNSSISIQYGLYYTMAKLQLELRIDWCAKEATRGGDEGATQIQTKRTKVMKVKSEGYGQKWNEINK